MSKDLINGEFRQLVAQKKITKFVSQSHKEIGDIHQKIMVKKIANFVKRSPEKKKKMLFLLKDHRNREFCHSVAGKKARN